MDPLTQGLLGAAASQAILGRRLGPRAWLYGAVGGMAADLDVLIRSSSDPLVAWRYHRHFTHSVAFVPVGGLLSALPWIVRPRFAHQRRTIIGGTTIGYATHALLDAFTSYGTMLGWPFTDARVAWSWIAIIDPIYTGLLAIGVIMAARRGGTSFARRALLLSSIYLVFGWIQRQRVLTAIRAQAGERGHSIERIDAFPSPPTNLMWRTLYQSDDRVWVDRVRAPWWGPALVHTGDSVALVTERNLPPAMANDPTIVAGVRTFQWFTQGWMAWEPTHPDILGDLRYGGPDDAAVSSMWGLQITPGEPQPLQAYRARMDDALRPRWEALWGQEP